MAQKITLSIPDMLHEKLKEWRDSFNLSKMFQEALTDAIHKKEEFQKRFSEDFDMPEIIKRLKEEKLAWVRQFYRTGKKEGLKWARSAHFEELMYVLHNKGTYTIVEESGFKAYFDTVFTACKIDQYPMENTDDNRKMFMDGWFCGVNEFWNQVKEEL